MKPGNLKHRLDAMESDELRRLQPTKSSAKPWRVSRQRSVGYISQMLREGFRLHTCEELNNHWELNLGYPYERRNKCHSTDGTYLHQSAHATCRSWLVSWLPDFY